MTFDDKRRLANQLEKLREQKKEAVADFDKKIAALVEMCEHSERQEDTGDTKCVICGKIMDSEYRWS